MGIFDGYLLMSDIDGTFELNDFKEPPKNIDAINYFTKNGGLFAFASGRMSDYIKRRGFDRLTNAPCCLCNGAFVYNTDTDEVLYMKTVPHTVSELAKHILPYTKGLIKFIAPIGTTTAYHEPIDINDIPADMADRYPSKQVNMFDTPEHAIEFEKNLKADPFFNDCYVCRSWETGVEVHKKDATKGQAIEFVKEYTGAHTSVAIGDYGNDVPMVRCADIGVAVENAAPELKDIADMVVCSCKDCAIADLIYKLEEKIANERK